MPTKTTENAKPAQKPATSKKLPKSSNAGHSARASTAYVRARPPVARAGR